MSLNNKRFWRITSWPVLIFTTIFFVGFPHWFDTLQVWAQSPPVWDEATGGQSRYEYDEKGRQTAVIKPKQLAQGAAAVEVKTTTVYDADGRAAATIFNHDDSATTDSTHNAA